MLESSAIPKRQPHKEHEVAFDPEMIRANGDHFAHKQLAERGFFVKEMNVGWKEWTTTGTLRMRGKPTAFTNAINSRLPLKDQVKYDRPLVSLCCNVAARWSTSGGARFPAERSSRNGTRLLPTASRRICTKSACTALGSNFKGVMRTISFRVAPKEIGSR